MGQGGGYCAARDHAADETGGPSMPMSHMEKMMFTNTSWPPSAEMPACCAVINGTLLFKTLPPAARVQETVIKAYMRFPRLRSIGQATQQWNPIDPETLDASQHFFAEAPVSTEVELSEAVGRIAMQPLDTGRPLWAVHTVPNNGTGFSAIVFRIHHSVGDGVHLSRVLMELVTDNDGNLIEGEDAVSKFEQMKQRLNGGGCVKKCTKSTGMCVCAVPAFCSNAMASVGRFEAETEFQRPVEERKELIFSGKRKILFVPPHSLKFVKACKDAEGVSVNDVVMSATVGAVRRYCESQGDSLFQADERASALLRALVPVAMPKQFPEGQDPYDCLINNWCFCSCSLAVGETSPVERLRATSREMGKLKRSMKPIVALWQVEKVVPLIPVAAAQDTLRDLFARHSMVFSNVPGPQQAMFFAGELVEGLQAVFVNAIPQIILTSYNGRIWMNCVVDPDVVSDVDLLGRCYLEELKALGAELGVPGDPVES